MRKLAPLILIASLVYPSTALAQQPPLLPEPVVAALAQELSGSTAKRNLEFLTRLHRQRGSRQFHAAAEFIRARLLEYGLEDAEILQFPADGKTYYGTQKARPAWDADFAELWELRQTADGWAPAERLASWDAMPITLAEDSESADVTADLIDVGNGTAESDYAGKDVRGKLVLAAAQPGPVARLAVDRFGAAGIVSYAQNQRTAWWKEDDNLVRWGHLDSFTPTQTFAFMVSLKRAHVFQRRLAAGETIRLHALVRAGRHSGFYDVVTATIPGDDPQLRQEEIAFSCHLDHQRPGANDNASGCVTILEIARTFAKLIAEGRLARPARTLRFIWPPEIEGTLALLNARPEFARRIKAVVHMDMVGGGPVTKAVFHVTRGPASLPSFVNDVAEAFGRFVNQQSDAFARGGNPPYPLYSPEGGKEALLAQFAPFDMGSDHQVYTEGSFRIPSIYLNDWPDRYIHTNFDSAANIDPTKLKRAGFIGAASAYFLATMKENDVPGVWQILKVHALHRTTRMMEHRDGLPPYEAANLTRFHMSQEEKLLPSVASFANLPDSVHQEAEQFWRGLRRITRAPQSGEVPPELLKIMVEVYSRNPSIKGPMSVFGYNYLTDHFGAEETRNLKLLRYQGRWGSGSEYAYEVLNFVNGLRTVREIRDAVAAEYGPIPIEFVASYLAALESIGVIKRNVLPGVIRDLRQR